MSEEESGIKVTDRRMFTETGELRQGFEDLDGGESDNAPAVKPPEAREVPSAQPSSPTASSPVQAASSPVQAAPPHQAQASVPPPGYEEAPGQPQFLDLVAMLAEPAALFLGDAAMPGQEPLEDLDRARMHIDLLGLLEDKCLGNLSEQESAVLADLVYRLRLRYVEKRGAST